MSLVSAVAPEMNESGRVERRVAVVGVVIGELGGAVRKLALEENRVPARGLAGRSQ